MASRKAPKAKAKKLSSKSVKRSTAAQDDDHLHDDNGICACDFKFSKKDATADADLPAARGGLSGEKYRLRA